MKWVSQWSQKRVASVNKFQNFHHHLISVNHHQHGLKLVHTLKVSIHHHVIPAATIVLSLTNFSVKKGKKLFLQNLHHVIVPLPFRYVPFGPDLAVCRKAASFWEIMPTYCVPKDFVPPQRWNVDMNNVGAYFNRGDEWEMVAAQLVTTTEAPTDDNIDAHWFKRYWNILLMGVGNVV